MAINISRVQYFYCNVRDRPGEAHKLLARLAASGVNLLAFNAIPMGLDQTQLILFPEDANPLARVAEEEGLLLDGPQFALLIRGDDELGTLAQIHHKLAETGVNVSASSGIADGRGGVRLHRLHCRRGLWRGHRGARSVSHGRIMGATAGP